MVTLSKSQFSPFFQTNWLGKRLQALHGAHSIGSLLDRLRRNDAGADSELTALHLLRSGHLEVEVEIGPEVAVGERLRRPDFHFRYVNQPGTYVEVTQLDSSRASERTQQVLQKIAGLIVVIPKHFILEMVLLREPTEAEADVLVQQVKDICDKVDSVRYDLGDLASVIVKSGDPAIVVPSILPADDGSRMAIAKVISGPHQPPRQFVARVPFADMRAEQVLTTKSRQLPAQESGLLMVDVCRQPSAFKSWPNLVPHRFSPEQHTRVGGVLLFHCAIMPTPDGTVDWQSMVSLIPNPHAYTPLPQWLVGAIEEIQAEHQRLFAPRI
jgi:hypothetical protein